MNLYGLANDMSILGSAYSAFQSTNCNDSYAAYPFTDATSNYTVWRDKGFNLFRLAFGWQHVQTSLGGPLNETTLESLDGMVNRITGDGNLAILDIVWPIDPSLLNSLG